jgi:hypothetical protein
MDQKNENNSNRDAPDLSREFKTLGKNLAGIFHAALENPEFRNLQDEISTGIQGFSETINSEMSEFSKSETASRIRTDVDELKKKVSNGEIGSKARNGLSKTIKKLNIELKNMAESLSEINSNPESPDNVEKEQEN